MDLEELRKKVKKLNYRHNRTSEEMRCANWRFHCARTRAKKKNFEFSLDREWFFDELDKGCTLTGWGFSLKTGHNQKNAMGPSIDRLDSNKGYTKDNCRLVLWCVNRALGEEDDNFMYMWAKEFVKRMEKEQ